jgi:hemoglobin-like flavoprotein
MTPEQIKLVKKTWKILRGIDAKIIGDAFYSKLFNDHPYTRKMFPKEMDQQFIKLIDMLSYVIMSLDRPQEIKNGIEAMAHRHKTYGVKPEHYNMVGEALFWTIKKGLGSEWNQEISEAWTVCYQTLAEKMVEKSET